MNPEKNRLFKQSIILLSALVVVFLLIFTACTTIKENKEKLAEQPKTIKIAYIKMPDDSVVKINLSSWSGYDPYAILKSVDGTKYRVSYEKFVIVEEPP